jgi:hypothetical protein
VAPKKNEAVETIQEFAKVRSRVFPFSMPSEPLGLKEKLQLYGSGGHGKPIVLAETAAPYTRLISTKQPERGGASEGEIKLTWLKQLFSDDMVDSVPDLKAISWVSQDLSPSAISSCLNSVAFALGAHDRPPASEIVNSVSKFEIIKAETAP